MMKDVCAAFVMVATIPVIGGAAFLGYVDIIPNVVAGFTVLAGAATCAGSAVCLQRSAGKLSLK